MKVKDLEGKLAELLEIPEDINKVGREILFGQLATQKMINLLVLRTAFECIFDDFEENLEKQGRGLTDEVNSEDLDGLIEVTRKFYSLLIQEDQSDYILKEARKEEKIILAAIEELRGTL